jgi:hypothetical protein
MKLLFAGVVLSVLLCSSLVVSVDAVSMWSRTYGGTGDDWANTLVATSDGGYAIAGIWNCTLADRRFSDDGYDGGDFWMIKTDALGNVQWNHTYGGAGSDWANLLIAAPEGGYIMAGAFTNSFGIGEWWLVKTDEWGNMQWNKTYGGFGGEACSVVAAPDGGYAIAGGSLLVKTDEFGVVPEYSSWLIPALVLTATALIIINKKKLIQKRSQKL